MKQVKYTSIDRIFAKLIRDLGLETVNEGDIIEWTGEALEAIGAVTLYEEAVAFIEVKNHQANIPSGLHSIIQIAKNHCCSGPKDSIEDLVCPQKVIENIDPVDEPRKINPCNCDNQYTCDCNGTKVDYTLLDCNGQPINAYDIAYYRPYFDLQYEYNLWRGSRYYGSCYSPVRLSNNTFFNSIVCREQEDNYYNTHNIYNTHRDEYTIIKGEILRFSFKEGSIALSYLRQVVDKETGYPMIPDSYSYTTAITKYITMKVMEREFYAGREGSAGRLQKAEADWQWYCKQAGNRAMMPEGIDDYQDILEQRNYIVPNLRHYYSFFGKLNTPENRSWNDPDRRNYFRGYFIGN